MVGEAGNEVEFVEEGVVFDDGFGEKGREGGESSNGDAGEFEAVVAEAATRGKKMGERGGAVWVVGCKEGLEEERFVSGELALKVECKYVSVEGDGERQRSEGGSKVGEGGRGGAR